MSGPGDDTEAYWRLRVAWDQLAAVCGCTAGEELVVTKRLRTEMQDLIAGIRDRLIAARLRP